MRGRYKRSKESKRRSSEARKKYFKEDKTARKKVAKNTMKQWARPDVRAEMVEAIRKASKRKDLREKRRKAALKRWRNPEFRKKIIKAQSGSNNANYNPNRDQVLHRNGKGFLRSQVKRLLHDKCDWCGSKKNLQLDHIIPVGAGGSSEDANAQTLCVKCNNKKRVTTDMELMKKWRENGGHLKRENPVPSWTRKSLEGVETKGRVVRCAGTRLLHIELPCEVCGKIMQKQPNQLKRAKKHYCSHKCRMVGLNKHIHDSNAHTSAPPERDDIVRTAR